MNRHDFDCECATCVAQDMTNAPTLTQMFYKPRKVVLTPVTVATVKTAATAPSRHLKAGQKVGNGRVRKISTRQESYILSLINARDTSKLHLAANQSIDPEHIPFMGLPAAKALIEKLLGCPHKGTNSPVMVSGVKYPARMATENQRDYFRNLNSQIKDPGYRITEDDILSITFAEVNKQLDFLKSIIKAETEEAKTHLKEAMTLANDSEEFIPDVVIPGFYRDNNNEMWKVQFNKAQTHMYALKQVAPKKYEFVSGAIKSITPDMFVSLNPVSVTLDEAKAYGRKTGRCYMCSRELTRQESIDKGIGPICESKF